MLPLICMLLLILLLLRLLLVVLHCVCCSGAQACRVQELDTVPSNFAAAPQSQSQSAAVFDPLAQSMVLHPKSDGPQRLTAKFPAQLYGQFEVSARISVHPSSYTSIDVSE
jgi:hypothetical protein